MSPTRIEDFISAWEDWVYPATLDNRDRARMAEMLTEFIEVVRPNPEDKQA